MLDMKVATIEAVPHAAANHLNLIRLLTIAWECVVLGVRAGHGSVVIAATIWDAISMTSAVMWVTGGAGAAGFLWNLLAMNTHATKQF